MTHAEHLQLAEADFAQRVVRLWHLEHPVTSTTTSDDRRTPEDLLLARAIMDDVDTLHIVQRVTSYYADLDRADRTPRATLYLHLGLLAGAYVRLATTTPPPPPGR